MKSVSDIISYEIKFHILDKLYNQMWRQVDSSIEYQVENQIRVLMRRQVEIRISYQVIGFLSRNKKRTHETSAR
jgi:hypothetical protein